MYIRYENKNHWILCKRGSRLKATAHLHSHIEIVYMLEGDTTVWVNDKKYLMHKGDLFISFPNQVHRYETTTLEDYFLIIFPDELCSEFSTWFSGYIPMENVLRCGEYDSEIVEHIINRMKNYDSRELGDFERIDAKGMLLSLMSQICFHLKFGEEKVGEISLIQQMLSYCATHFKEELTLEILEQELHVNRYYISRLFSGKVKIKFNDHLNSLRVSHAAKLLRESDLSMTEIMDESGFTTSRTFNRAFKRIMNESPSQYRKRAKVKRMS